MSCIWSFTAAVPPVGPIRSGTTARWNGCCVRWRPSPRLVAVQKRQMRQRTGGRSVSAVPRHPSRNLHSGGVRPGQRSGVQPEGGVSTRPPVAAVVRHVGGPSRRMLRHLALVRSAASGGGRPCCVCGAWSAADVALPRQVVPAEEVAQLPLQRGISSVVLNRTDWRRLSPFHSGSGQAAATGRPWLAIQQ